MRPKLGTGNFYSGLVLDRADHLRQDVRALARHMSDPESRIYPIWNRRPLVRGGESPQALWFSGARAQEVLALARETVFAGIAESRAVFFADLSHIDVEVAFADLSPEASFTELRSIATWLERSEAALLAYARAMVHWHERHLFCGLCGSETESQQGGHQRRCLSSECRAVHFPRCDPAVIMLVHDGARCLLGRQASWPPGRYSTLAGFVEPGECLEEAVAREVREEAGIEVGEVTYHSSQPWPFPSSIMLGFFAAAKTTELRINLAEIEDARWFTLDQVLSCPNDESFALPSPDSIARRLVNDWATRFAQGQP
jgi:NAD+ diphosphatase